MKVIILGDGGHSRVIQEMLERLGTDEVIAILDDKYTQGFQRNGVIHAAISFLWNLLRSNTKIVVAIGNNEIRKKIVDELNLPPSLYLSVIHPTAVISTSSMIGSGTVIMPYAVVNAKADIGRHCIINTAAVVEHDSEIGVYTHISPNATLAGNVSTGEGVHVGSAATIIPGKHIGRWSVIGAGSTVIETIPGYSKAVGSPARIIERILIK